MSKLFQQGTRGQGTHVLQWLPNGGQAGNDVGSGLNVVEAEHRDVGWNLQPCVVECANASDGGDVVKTEDCCKVSAPQQQLLDAGVA